MSLKKLWWFSILGGNMGERNWKVEGNHRASLYTKRQWFLWSICHEGMYVHYYIFQLQNACIHSHYKVCWVHYIHCNRKAPTKENNNLNAPRQSMAIQLLDASGIATPQYLYQSDVCSIPRVTSKLLSSVWDVQCLWGWRSFGRKELVLLLHVSSLLRINFTYKVWPLWLVVSPLLCK